MVWEVRATRFFPYRDDVPGAEGVLLVAREVLTGERKYFLAHAPTETAVAEMLCVAFSRWHIERLFEDSKGEVGLDHFEVRTYRSLRRHLVLTQLSLGFLADQTSALRGKKLVVEPVSGTQGGRGAARHHVAESGHSAPLGTDCREDRVLAASS